MKVLAISLFLLGIIVALFSKQIDQLAKRHLSIKYLLIVIMTGLGIFIIVTLYNILKENLLNAPPIRGSI